MLERTRRTKRLEIDARGSWLVVETGKDRDRLQPVCFTRRRALYSVAEATLSFDCGLRRD